MTGKVRVTRIMLVAIVLVGALSSVTSARATDTCGSLSEGRNDLPLQGGCFTLDVPEGVDMLKVAFPGFGGLWSSTSGTLCSFYAANGGGDYYSDDDVCAVPAPSAERLIFGAADWPRGDFVWVEFGEAQPVIGAASGNLYGTKDGAMFRFDGLEHAAIISTESLSDLNLRVRRGAPPTRDEADCVSTTTPPGWVGVRGNEVYFAAEAEHCTLDAGTGPVYAFVTFNRTTSITAYSNLTGRVPIWPCDVGGPCDRRNVAISGADA